MPSPRETKVKEELTHCDWLGATIALVGTMFCCRFALFIGPRFQQLFEGFGSEPPALTRLVFMPWFSLLLGLIPAFMVALALVGKPSLGVRRGLIGGASFLSVVASGLCLYGIYSPIFAMVEFIK